MEEEFVTLKMIKTHLNIEQDYHSEDDYGSSDIWSDGVLKRRKPLNKLYI